MSILSKSCEYGLRAAMYIATQPAGELINIRDISRELDISFHFLTKILQKLTRNGILSSSRGATGGVKLAKLPRAISLWDVVVALEENDAFSSCVLGLTGCGNRNPCPLHATWAVERARLEKMFRRTSLEKVSGPVSRGAWRLDG